MLDKVQTSETESAVTLPAAFGPEPTEPVRSRLMTTLGWFLRTFFQVILMVAIIAGAAFIAYKMVQNAPPPRKRPVFKTVYTIDAVTVQKASNQPSFTSYGQTAAARSVDLRALVSGEIVAVSDKLRAGARVEKGEELLSIDPFAYEGALQEANANLAEARAKVVENEARIASERTRLESLQEQVDLAEADLDRLAQLRKRGQSTQQQLEARKLVVSQREQARMQARDNIDVELARLDQLKASLDRLQWRVSQAQRNVDSTRLIAPFTGIVRSSTAEIGRLINANDVVVSMYEAETLEVRFTLTDAQYGRLQTDPQGLIGRDITVLWTIDGRDWTWPGSIDRLGADITSNRGGVEVFAKVGVADNPVTMRPGAFVEVRVPDKVFENSFALPDSAIYGADTVYSIVDGQLQENQIRVLAYEGDQAIVAGALNDGDRVMTTRITEVSAGLNVRTEEEAAAEQQARSGAPAQAGERQSSATGEGPARGRPSRAEIAKIIAANGIDMAAFRALEPQARRQMIRDWRAANPEG